MGDLTLRNGAALAAVSFTATGGASCSTSNASGQYACTLPLGWTGTLTPSLSGYVFTPPWRAYNNVISDQTGQSFTAAVDSSLAKAFYIHPDHLNTPRVITNQAQQIVWRWDNDDPFGGNMANENPSGLGTFTCNLRFPGQYFDRETNMHYNYFRDYSPEIGRYIESDPIGLDGGLNTYAYANGNPLSLQDPLGLASICLVDKCPPPEMKQYVKCISDCADNNVKNATKCAKVPPRFRSICLAKYAGERVICVIQCSVKFPDCWRKTLD
jgi:RHS repeat-associated protein